MGRLTFTRDGDWHHWICAVSVTKQEAKLHIHNRAPGSLGDFFRHMRKNSPIPWPFPYGPIAC